MPCMPRHGSVAVKQPVILNQGQPAGPSLLSQFYLKKVWTLLNSDTILGTVSGHRIQMRCQLRFALQVVDQVIQANNRHHCNLEFWKIFAGRKRRIDCNIFSPHHPNERGDYALVTISCNNWRAWPFDLGKGYPTFAFHELGFTDWSGATKKTINWVGITKST